MKKSYQKLQALKAKSLALKTATTAAVLTAASGAYAAGPSAGDLSSLTPDGATIITGVGAVFVVLAGVYLAIKGGKIIVGLIRR